MDLELAKEERKIFDKGERDFSFYLAPQLQKQMKTATLKELGITEADLDGDPDSQKIYLNNLNGWVCGVLLSMKYDFPKPPGDSNVQPTKTKKKLYRKPFERRFRLVKFIIDSWARDARDDRSRINWERVTSEWNEAHPYDQFENPISLKSLYNQAIREHVLMLQLLLLHMLRETGVLSEIRKIKKSQGEREAYKRWQSFVKNQFWQFLSQDSKAGRLGRIVRQSLEAGQPGCVIRQFLSQDSKAGQLGCAFFAYLSYKNLVFHRNRKQKEATNERAHTSKK